MPTTDMAAGGASRRPVRSAAAAAVRGCWQPARLGSSPLPHCGAPGTNRQPLSLAQARRAAPAAGEPARRFGALRQRSAAPVAGGPRSRRIWNGRERPALPPPHPHPAPDVRAAARRALGPLKGAGGAAARLALSVGWYTERGRSRGLWQAARPPRGRGWQGVTAAAAAESHPQQAAAGQPAGLPRRMAALAARTPFLGQPGEAPRSGLALCQDAGLGLDSDVQNRGGHCSWCQGPAETRDLLPPQPTHAKELSQIGAYVFPAAPPPSLVFLS